PRQPAGRRPDHIPHGRELRCFRVSLNSLDGISRLDVQYADGVSYQLLELARAAAKDREGAEVHRDDGLDAEQLDGLGGPLRTHRVPAADGQEGDVEAAELRDQRHVAEDVGVAGEVDGEAVLELDHEAARVTAVDDGAVLGDAARMLGVDQRDLDAVHFYGSALVGA